MPDGPLRHIRLSPSQREYLMRAQFIPTSIMVVVHAALVGGSPDQFEIDGVLAEAFRDVLTERLAKVGFDGDYGLTAEGKILEGLVDALFGA